MNKNLTEIAYILDRSGSMSGMEEAAITGFNEFLQSQMDEPGDVNLSLLLFDNEFNLVHDRAPLQEVRQLDAQSYVPRGSTALLDAIGRAIDALGRKIAKQPEDQRPGKVIIAIYTDGYENASQQYDLRKINKMISHQRGKYSWEFMFLAANEDAIATASQMGIARDMASVSAMSDKGVRSSSRTFDRKIKSMRKMMSTGEMDEDYLKSIDMIRKEEEDRPED